MSLTSRHWKSIIIFLDCDKCRRQKRKKDRNTDKSKKWWVFLILHYVGEVLSHNDSGPYLLPARKDVQKRSLLPADIIYKRNCVYWYWSWAIIPDNQIYNYWYEEWPSGQLVIPKIVKSVSDWITKIKMALAAVIFNILWKLFILWSIVINTI